MRGAVRRAPGDGDSKNGSSFRGTFHQDFSPVILHNFLHNRQTKPGAVLLTVTHKRGKQLVTDRFGDARTVVGNRNGNGSFAAPDRDLNPALSGRGRLASVQQKIVQGPFEFARIEPCQALAVAFKLDKRSLMAWVQAYCLHSSLYGFRNAGVSGIERFPGPGEFEQGIDEVRHLIYADANLLIQLFALSARQAAIAEELRIGNDRRQGMAQVVRD